MNASLNLNPVNFLIISGILQCLIISAVLFIRRSERVISNRILALILLAVCMHLAFFMLLDLNLDNRKPQVLWMPYSYLLGIGPLIFYYTRSLVFPQFQLTDLDIKHFVPLLLEIGIQLCLIFYSILTSTIYYNVPGEFVFSLIAYTGGSISIFYYLKKSLSLIQRREKWLLENLSSLQKTTLQWLYNSIRYYRITWLLWIPFAIIFMFFFRFQWQHLLLLIPIYLLLLIITYLTYWMGIDGFRHLEVINYKIPLDKKASVYKNIDVTDIENYKNQLTALMEKEKLFLNERLELRTMAMKLQIEANLLSFILNQHMGKSFYDYVNTYRVEEVKRKMNDPAFNHLTILGIALESGFNSKTSFNRIFKQLTGMTPTTYQKSLKK